MKRIIVQNESGAVDEISPSRGARSVRLIADGDWWRAETETELCERIAGEQAAGREWLIVEDGDIPADDVAPVDGEGVPTGDPSPRQAWLRAQFDA